MRELKKGREGHKFVQLFPRCFSIEVPEDYKDSKIGDILEFSRGLSYEGSKINNKKNGNLLINLNCFNKKGGFNIEGVKYYTGKIEPNIIVNEGDILIANTDVTREGEVIGYPIEIPHLASSKIIVHSLDT